MRRKGYLSIANAVAHVLGAIIVWSVGTPIFATKVLPSSGQDAVVILVDQFSGSGDSLVKYKKYLDCASSATGTNLVGIISDDLSGKEPLEYLVDELLRFGLIVEPKSIGNTPKPVVAIVVSPQQGDFAMYFDTESEKKITSDRIVEIKSEIAIPRFEKGNFVEGVFEVLLTTVTCNR